MTDQVLTLAQAAPHTDGMYWLMLTSRVLHILAAIILGGGLFYLWAVVSPTVTGSNASSTDQLFGGRRGAWAMWVGIASLLLLVTGLWNYMQIIQTNEKMASSYHMIAGMKMLAGIALFFLAAILSGRSAAAESLRSKMRLWISICLILGVITVVLGSVLRSYPHIIKSNVPAPPAQIAQ